MAPTARDVTAVVPARNAAALLPRCLSGLLRAGLAEVIVVDGRSSDDSRAIARAHGCTVLSDQGRGLPWARTLGIRQATTDYVFLCDADVVVDPGTVDALLREFLAGSYTALQAGLESVGGPGYWGRALAHHHRTGRSRTWFGLVATIARRETLLEAGFDDRFVSGEDIELRWRLRQGGRRIGVSGSVMVEHRFAEDSYAFAQDQFLMDGFGLGRMVRTHGWRGIRLALLPLAAAVRGAALSVAQLQPRWLLYYLAFCAGNYRGMARGLRR